MSFVRFSYVAIGLAFFSLFFSPPQIYAQGGDQIHFERLTTEHGLPGDWIRGGVVQDSHGFVWIATNNGLSRFDGYQFKNYRHQPDNPDSLSNNGIRAIAIDATDIIWLATGGGLNRFDPVTETAASYQHNPDNPNSLSDNDLREILIDSNGIIWIGTAEGGLNRFDPATETFTRFQHQPNSPESLGSNRVSALFEDSAKQVWVGTRQGGLQRLNPGSNTFTTYRHNPATPNSLSNNTVITIFEDKAGVLWVGTTAGLNSFNLAAQTFTRHNLNPATPASFSEDNIQTIVPVQGEPGRLWIGTDKKGLKKLDTVTGNVVAYQNDPLLLTSLSDNDVIAVFTDQSGVVWVGTRNGLNRFVPFSQQFPYYTRQPGATNTLSDDFVQAIYQDATGIVWLGTNAGGLNRFDPNSGSYTHYRHNPADANSPLNDDIEAIEPGQPGVLWFGYDADGLSKFEPERGTFTHYLPDNSNPNSIPVGRIQRSLTYDYANNLLWLGLDGGGLARFDPETEIFTTYRHQPDNPNSLSSNRIKQVFLGQGGIIWAGSVGPELNRLDPASEQVTRYPYETDKPNARVTILHQTPDGIMWVKAGSTLLKFNPAAGQFFEDDETALWAGQGIGKISVGQNGDFWMGDTTVLSRYNPQSGQIIRFDKRDGFIFCCRGWFLNQETGQFFTSSSNERGFHSFNINQIQPRTYQPPVVLTEFYLFGQPAPIGGESPLQQAIFAANSLTLSNSHNFAFEFAALDYAAPNSIQYRYRLDGFEDNWNSVGPQRRYAAYTSLPAGNYTFQVQATNSQGQWSRQEAILHLTIVPPWWQTRWFQALAVVVVGVLILGGYVWQKRQADRRTHLLEEKVAERTQALADSEARFRGLSASTFEAVIIHNQGRILDANQAVEVLLGYSRNELIGRHINRLIATDSQQRVTQQLQNSSEEPYEVNGITKSGTIIPLEIRARVVPFQGHQVRVAAARDLTERRQIEAHKQRLAAMEERERIGRDLHDDLGQVMAYVSLQAQSAREFLEHQRPNKAMATLAQLIQAANQAHNDVRRYILGVRTAQMPATNLFEELIRYLTHLRQQHGLSVHTSWPDDLPDSPLSPEVETQLLRIIQEALTNVRKHAAVKFARILFTQHADEMQVVISDEGSGFRIQDSGVRGQGLGFRGQGTVSSTPNPQPPTPNPQSPIPNPQPPTPSFGLEIMRERAESVGGRLDIRSEPGGGTQIIVHLPTMLKTFPETALYSWRILLVDDHPLYRDGLRTLLSSRGVQVVGMASDGLEAQTMARQRLPDLILMDVEMPRCNGLEATRRIKADLPDIKIVMLTVAADDETLFEALKAGASGYLLKNLEGRQFFTLLTEVMRGETVLSPALAARVLAEMARPAAKESPETMVLTTRQQEVLELVAQGLSNREIADSLHITERTVKHHVSLILERLQLRNRYEMAQYAQDHRLV